MSRIIAVDYGQKRVGLAVTDENRIIATALETIHSKDIFSYLKQYIEKEKVSIIVVGEPRQMNNTPSESVKFINPFVKKLRKEFPGMEIQMYDERFTSKMAFQSMIDMGMKKKDRQNKANVDKISAVILLQSYLEYLSNKR
jgi:putative Holliday junction resolvase